MPGTQESANNIFRDEGLRDYESQDYEADPMPEYKNSMLNEHTGQKKQHFYKIWIPDFQNYNLHDSQVSEISKNEAAEDSYIIGRRQDGTQEYNLKIKRGRKFHKPDGRIRLLKNML